MEKSQHTNYNEDTTNESASMACSNTYVYVTLRKIEEIRLKTLEIKGLILRVSWIARKTNEWVLNKSCSKEGTVRYC